MSSTASPRSPASCEPASRSDCCSSPRIPTIQAGDSAMSYDCSCDYDAPEFYHKETRKARFPHKCGECRGPISPGETYEHVRGKWNGDIDSYKTCALCVELREWATISVPCFCGSHGNLHDDVRAMVDEVRHGVPGFIFEWGRRMVKINRQRGHDRASILRRRAEVKAAREARPQ